MKHIKKVITLLLSAMMILAMSATAFAEDAAPSGGLTVDPKISVTGLDNGDTVNFYKILKWDNGWKLNDDVSLTDEEVAAIIGDKDNPGKISAEIAVKLSSQTLTAKYGPLTAESNKVEKESPEAGLYMALISPAKDGTVYNPVFVGADYKQNATSDSSSWNVKTDLSYEPAAMAKKASTTLEKTSTKLSANVGEMVPFTVDTTIPAFGKKYTKPVFKVTDVLSTGLELDAESITLVAPTGLTKDEDYTITPNGTSGYTLAFSDTYLKTVVAATPVKITYQAELTNEAPYNVNHEDNTVTVNYSNKPTDEEGKGTLKDKTNHYTFDIDGDLFGNTSYKLTEVVKVGLDKDGKEITETKVLSNGNSVGALQGAEFTLYTDSSCSKQYSNDIFDGKITTDAQGRLSMKGLAAGTYYLKETKAPDGYIADTTKVTSITIEPTYEEVEVTEKDGSTYTTQILKSYTVSVDGTQTAAYEVTPTGEVTRVDGKTTTVTYTNESTKVTDISEVDAGDDVVGADGLIGAQGAGANAAAGKITNTQGTELPSTGGIGTVIFYVLGSLLVVGCGIVLISKRRLNSTK